MRGNRINRVSLFRPRGCDRLPLCVLNGRLRYHGVNWSVDSRLFPGLHGRWPRLEGLATLRRIGRDLSLEVVLGTNQTHDLHDFMRQISDEMSAEYARIQKRALEDPGTAGDQGEENWAELLRGWIPNTYEVVTKGRIISEDGRTSPQIDVIVLKDIYPKKLLTKKLYLAAGVAAAFECKTTLRTAHIRDAAVTCVALKELYSPRTGSPYLELHSPILYGLLSHSHSWKSDSVSVESLITGRLMEYDQQYVRHPREALDMICVADLGTWTSGKITFLGPSQISFADNPAFAEMYGPLGSAVTDYVKQTGNQNDPAELFTPIGALIANLTRKLAWEIPNLRALADYYTQADVGGPGQGYGRNWPSSIYSDEIRRRVERGDLSNGKKWDEWSIAFF